MLSIRPSSVPASPLEPVTKMTFLTPTESQPSQSLSSTAAAAAGTTLDSPSANATTADVVLADRPSSAHASTAHDAAAVVVHPANLQLKRGSITSPAAAAAAATAAVTGSAAEHGQLRLKIDAHPLAHHAEDAQFMSANAIASNQTDHHHEQHQHQSQEQQAAKRSPIPPVAKPRKSPEAGLSHVHKYDHFFWAIACQKGFRLDNDVPIPLHHHMEDTSWPQSDSPRMPISHPKTNLPYYMWCLADGHGGHYAARWFMSKLSLAMREIIEANDWHFDVMAERTLFTEVTHRTFMDLDKEYCKMKIAEFEAWKASNSAYARPEDDGCTMVVNVIYKGYAVNINLGDSRTILGARPIASGKPHDHMVPVVQPSIDYGPHAPNPLGASTHSEGDRVHEAKSNKGAWKAHFISTDHTPNHPARAFQLQMNGGLFTDSFGRTCQVQVFPPADHPEHYEELDSCRIRRAPTYVSTELSVPLRTTLNLAGTLGDLNFKLSPALISPVPDVRFIKLTSGFEYIIVMASDGVWDHLDEQESPTAQAEAVLRHIGADMMREEASWAAQRQMENAEHGMYKVFAGEYHALLQRTAESLCERVHPSDLYSEIGRRYDDVTAMVGLVVVD